jgi:serine/threonine-protein kinase
MTLSVDLKKWLWVLPFLVCAIGYLIPAYILQEKSFPAPNLMGKTIEQAVILFAQHNLNPRIVGYKEEADLPAGTILNQTPQAGQYIKSNQSLFLVLSQKPPTPHAPSCINKNVTDIRALLHSASIRHTIHYVPSSYKKGYCVAQSPKQGEALTEKPFIVYIANDTNEPIVWPNFIGQRIEDTRDFLAMHAIKPEIVHTKNSGPSHQCHNCIITDQRPAPGTLINLSADMHVQLAV